MIYHQDKFGKKRVAGSVLSQGRQAQGVGSQFKKWVNNGVWFWKLKNIAELIRILAQYFFMVESKGDVETKTTKITSEWKEKVKVKEVQKSFLLAGKKYNIQAKVLSKQKTCLEDIWKVFYLDCQNQKKYFLVNNYQKSRTLSQLEIGVERNILLVNGWKHSFLSKIF